MLPRRVELVWRDLNALGSSGPVLHSTRHSYGTSLRNLFDLIKKSSDSRGPYVYGKVPKAAHYALRVEKYVDTKTSPGDTSAWQYFSLIRGKDDICELSEESFQCPDGRDKMWDSATYMDIETIRKRAQELVTDAGKYRLFDNNCQNFAAALLLYIEPIHDAPSSLHEYIQEKRLVPAGVSWGNNISFSSNNSRDLATVNDSEEYDRYWIEKIHGHEAWEEVKKGSREDPHMRDVLKSQGWSLPDAKPSESRQTGGNSQ